MDGVSGNRSDTANWLDTCCLWHIWDDTRRGLHAPQESHTINGRGYEMTPIYVYHILFTFHQSKSIGSNFGRICIPLRAAPTTPEHLLEIEKIIAENTKKTRPVLHSWMLLNTYMVNEDAEEPQPDQPNLEEPKPENSSAEVGEDLSRIEN